MKINWRDFFKFQMRPNYIRIKAGRLNLYAANHAMQLIQFEKQARRKKRRRLRGMALDRAGHKCEICGCALDWASVSIHHIKPKAVFPELEFDPGNVQALCLECHRRVHEYERMAALGILPAAACNDNRLQNN